MGTFIIFFDNVSLLEFVSKHKERLHFHSWVQGFEVFHLRDSDMLSTITKNFEFYIQESREELLPFVSHKFEGLFLYLSVQYARFYKLCVADHARLCLRFIFGIFVLSKRV